MPAACRAAEIVVVASREAEAFGRASAEAQAAERPVIVADRGALPETLVPMRRAGDDGTGWLVAPDNAEALAACLDNALRLPPESLARMGAHGRAHVVARFTTQAMQTATLEVYDALLGSRLRKISVTRRLRISFSSLKCRKATGARSPNAQKCNFLQN